MEGDPSSKEHWGVMSRCFDSIFSEIDSMAKDIQFLVWASYLEIYKENVWDLLSSNHKEKLMLHEKKDSGVYVKDLSSFIVKSADELQWV